MDQPRTCIKLYCKRFVLLRVLLFLYIIKAISHINPTCDPNFEEALVALLAASLAVTSQLKNFIIEGDSHCHHNPSTPKIGS
jgi:hypothetical protein